MSTVPYVPLSPVSLPLIKQITYNPTLRKFSVWASRTEGRANVEVDLDFITGVFRFLDYSGGIAHAQQLVALLAHASGLTFERVSETANLIDWRRKE